MISVGVDIGNATSCVATARGQAVDIQENADGLRETPSAVWYGEKSRAVGLKASNRKVSHPATTLVEVKRLMGRTYKTLEDKEASLYVLTECPQSGACLISVTKEKALRPEQVIVSLMKDLTKTVELQIEGGKQINSCVLSIPCFYGQAERYLMLAAAKVAGLQQVTLMHELTAAAVCWGVSRAGLPDDNCEPRHVALVDVGHCATQVRHQLAPWYRV